MRRQLVSKERGFPMPVLALTQTLISSLSLAFGLAQSPAVARPVPAATVALVEAWPDGRTNYELVSTRLGKMWTPKFPRIAGYKRPDGTLPVFAVQITRVLEGPNIKATVSLLMGA